MKNNNNNTLTIEPHSDDVFEIRTEIGLESKQKRKHMPKKICTVLFVRMFGVKMDAVLLAACLSIPHFTICLYMFLMFSATDLHNPFHHMPVDISQAALGKNTRCRTKCHCFKHLMLTGMRMDTHEMKKKYMHNNKKQTRSIRRRVQEYLH